MNTEKRIQIIKVIEKIDKNKTYAKKIGIMNASTYAYDDTNDNRLENYQCPKQMK